MKDLGTLTTEELKDFFNSFDTVLSDIDGVIWTILRPIPGASDAINNLRKLNKNVFVLTNNTATPVEDLHHKMKKENFDIEESHILSPAHSSVWYLKKQKLKNNKIFVLGSPYLRNFYKEAGFTLAENLPPLSDPSVVNFALSTTKDDGSVSAVICDIDLNVDYVNLQQATTYLKRPEVLFLKGATDRTFPIAPDTALLGPGVFPRILENMIGREAVPMAKPGPNLGRYVLETFGIKDVSRVLFIGDSIPEDMGFASELGSKKLLTLSGITNKENLENWTYSEELKPDFYVKDLGGVQKAIEKVFGKKL